MMTGDRKKLVPDENMADLSSAPLAENENWPTAKQRAANIAQAKGLKETAEAGGLRFDVYLPPDLAVWLLERIEQGSFLDPGNAAFVIFGEARDLHPHRDLRQELLRRTIQASIDDPRSSILAEEVFKADLPTRFGISLSRKSPTSHAPRDLV